MIQLYQVVESLSAVLEQITTREEGRKTGGQAHYDSVCRVCQASQSKNSKLLQLFK